MSKARDWALRSPTVVIMTAFMLAPMVLAVAYSFMTAAPYGGVTLPFTFSGYQQSLFQEDFDGSLYFSTAYLMIAVRSVGLALATVAITIIVGVPLAWYIASAPKHLKSKLLLLITLPFWINTLIRTYCWVLILRDEGLLNQGLRKLGLIDGYIQFLYNDGAILLGMVYTYLPFMVLPVYAVLERVNNEVVEASYDLYATRWATFRRIVFPLSKPGVIAGGLLVFAPSLGSFLAPDLLGGGRKLMIGSLIQLQFTSSRNWPFGSALATIVTVTVLVVLLLIARKNLQKVVGQ